MPVASPRQWELARTAVLEGCTYEEAALQSKIPLSTIQKRAREEGWQADRAAAQSYSERVRALKGTLLARIEASTGDADALSKYMASWRQAEQAYPELRKITDIPRGLLLGVASKVLRSIVDYLAEHDRDALAALEPHLDGLAARLEEQFGGR